MLIYLLIESLHYVQSVSETEGSCHNALLPALSHVSVLEGST